VLALAQAWANDGVLDDADDIFFLAIEDIEHSQNLKKIAAKNKAFYKSFQNFANPNELGNKHIARPAKVDKTQLLKGVPCSGAGTVTATARVIKDIHDVGRIEAGDILVTTCTDTAWTTVFGKLRGVITETGGMLSHAAVVSREFGIACVMVVKDACEVIKDGDVITINSETGEIYHNN